jgi:hypothetical protein
VAAEDQPVLDSPVPAASPVPLPSDPVLGTGTGPESELSHALIAEPEAIGEPADPGLGPRLSPAALAVPLLVGAAVAVSLGVYAGVHTPQGREVSIAGFPNPPALKAWLTALAAALAAAQLASALVMYGKVPLTAPSWIGRAHRWTGRAAFTVLIPVAVHCLYALGFQAHDPRVLAHSALGCALFGALTVKLLVLTRDDTPGWVLPVAGGAVFTGVVGVWLSGSLWFFAVG